MPPSARITIKENREWVNRHQNVSQQVARLIDVWPPMTDAMTGLRATTDALRKLIGDAAQGRVSMRALGNSWSLSRAAATDGWLVNTKPLNWIFTLSAASVSAEYAGDRSGLFFVQCGASILELNTYVESHGRALKTSGASNGQTFAGALSTGTHGSAIDGGSMQDYVVALHLVVGADRHVWLERASQPVVSDDFIDRLGAELVRDDTIFNAALVSFGSFGFIHAVVIDTYPKYLLEAYRTRMPLDAALRRAMTKLEFDDLALPHGTERPHHFEVIFNPHDVVGGGYVTTMYRRPYTEDYPCHADTPGGLGPGDDALSVIGTISDAVPPLVPTIVGSLADTLYPFLDGSMGTPGETFKALTVSGKGTSTEIGVPLDMAAAALECVFAAHAEAGPFGGFVPIRFVKGSKALLAFTRFDWTCTLEFPGVFSARSESFYRKVWRELEDAGIPYTLHWGQRNNFTPDRVRQMYGADCDRWVDSRHALLDADARRVFTNDFLVDCGLAG